MTTFVMITNAGKGKPYRLLQSIDNTNKNLKIGIKKISGRVGWYNIEEELEWRYTYQGQAPSEPIKIKPGLYNFDQLVKEFSGQIDGLEIEVDKVDGKIDMTIPDQYQVWLPERVREMLGLDDTGWLHGDYTGDHAVEFLPRSILVYLKQLSTTDNLQGGVTLNNSQFLGFVDLSNSAFGEYFVSTYEKPSFKTLQNTSIHELDFDFKVEWTHRTRKLDNHDQPLNLELEIK